MVLPLPPPSTDHASAATALARVNKVVLFGQEVRVNWAFQKELKSDSASYVHVFVGDLSSDITDAMLFQVRGVRGPKEKGWLALAGGNADEGNRYTAGVLRASLQGCR